MCRQESGAKFSGCFLPARLILLSVFCRDLFDQETDVVSGERLPVMTKRDMRVVAIEFDLYPDLYLPADMHVLCVLDKLPDPAFRRG